MSLDDLTAQNIAPANGKFERQRANNGLIEFTGVDDSDTTLKFALQSFTTPKQENAILEENYLNEKRRYAGPMTVGEIDVVLKDYVDNHVAFLCWQWRMEVYDPFTGKIGLARNYKKPGRIRMYSPEGSIERTYQLIGCWPSNLDIGDYDHTAEEGILITMTVVIDKFQPESSEVRPESKIA